MEGLVRAALLQSNLAALETLPDGGATRARGRIAAAMLHEIEGSLRTAWLPVSYDVGITEAVSAEIGNAAMRRWACDGLLRVLKSPLLGPMVQSATALFGLSPVSYIRWAPRMWPLVYRNCGTLVFQDGDDTRGVLVLENLSRALLGSTPYLEGLAGSFEAAFALANISGTVELAVEPRQVVFSFRW